MDFIEQWLGVSPDGGDGSLELLYIAAIIVIALAVASRMRLRKLVRGNPSDAVRGPVDKVDI
jgi:hypothetical protein